MGKLKKNEILIKSPGLQIREQIIEKYGTIGNFADEIGMYDSSVEQYLTTRNLGSTTFKIKLTNAFQKSLNELYLTDEAQIRKMTMLISEHIFEYNQYKDIEILEKVKDICIKREMLEDYAIICRAFAIFFYNQKKIDRALAYMQLAVNYLRGKEPVDRFVMYLSELTMIEAELSLRSRINRLIAECLSLVGLIQNDGIVCEIFTNIGKSLFKLGDYNEAEKYYAKSLNLHNSDYKDAGVLQLIGDIYIIKGKYELAFNSYSEAEEIIGSNDKFAVPLLHRFSEYYKLIGEYSIAEKYIDLVISKTRNQITATNNRFLVTLAEIKMHYSKDHEVLMEICNLLNELKWHSIYAEQHIKQLENIVEMYRLNLTFLNSINKLLINFYNENELEQEFLDAIKIVIGRTVLETHCANQQNNKRINKPET